MEASCLPFINRLRAPDACHLCSCPSRGCAHTLLGVLREPFHVSSLFWSQRCSSCMAPGLPHQQALANMHSYKNLCSAIHQSTGSACAISTGRLEGATLLQCRVYQDICGSECNLSCQLTIPSCLIYNNCPSGVGYLLYKGQKWTGLPQSPTGLFQLLGTPVSVPQICSDVSLLSTSDFSGQSTHHKPEASKPRCCDSLPSK